MSFYLTDFQVLFALIRNPFKPIEEKFSKIFEENQNNLVYQVWSNLIPWHQDVTNAWKKGDEKADLPRLNVNALTSINVDIDPAVYNQAGFQIDSLSILIGSERHLAINLKTLLRCHQQVIKCMFNQHLFWVNFFS